MPTEHDTLIPFLTQTNKQKELEADTIAGDLRSGKQVHIKGDRKAVAMAVQVANKLAEEEGPANIIAIVPNEQARNELETKINNGVKVVSIGDLLLEGLGKDKQKYMTHDRLFEFVSKSIGMQVDEQRKADLADAITKVIEHEINTARLDSLERLDQERYWISGRLAETIKSKGVFLNKYSRLEKDKISSNEARDIVDVLFNTLFEYEKARIEKEFVDLRDAADKQVQLGKKYVVLVGLSDMNAMEQQYAMKLFRQGGAWLITYSDSVIYSGNEADTKLSMIAGSLDSPFYANAKEYLLPDAKELKSMIRSQNAAEQNGICLADALKSAIDDVLAEVQSYEQKKQTRRK
ncbi:MAG: hypothetical protein ACP5TJ_03180 [Candidatus Micrarchaeia archaeon]